MADVVADCKIGIIALSDHAPVELVVEMKSSKPNGGRWRLNASVLQDPILRASMDTELKSFLDQNIGSTEKISSVWEASKAFMRGHFISKSSYLEKKALI